MNQLTTRQNTLPSPSEIEQISSICKVLSTSPYYQKLGHAGVLSIWLTAREMGLPPMMCLNGGMYTFSGAVTLSARLINMMIVNSGHRVDILQLTDTICTLRFVRGDREAGCGDTFEYTYTIEEAVRAGLTTKTNWKTNPKDMLYARCLSGGARKFMPDVMLTCYAEGEIDERENLLKIEQKPEIKKITDEQATYLEENLKRCPESCQKKIYEYMKTHNAQRFQDMNQNMFDSMSTAIANWVREIEKRKAEESKNAA